MGYTTELGGCGRCIKYALFFTNFIIFIGGLVITGVSIWALIAQVPWIEELIGNNMLTGTTYVLLVGGIVVTLIAFFGCVGASREIKCMLLLYFVIVLILFVVILLGGIMGYVYRDKVMNTLEREMESSLHAYSERKSIRDAWDATQSTIHCCGVHGWRDWPNKGYGVPSSCCREVTPGQRMHCNTREDSLNPSNAYLEGCLNGTTAFMQKHAAIFGGCGVTVAAFLLFGMTFSCILFRKIH